MAELKVPVTRNDHIAGGEHAPVTLLEYGDYQCPYCGAAHPVLKAVRKHFGDRLRFAYRHFPLQEIHSLAEPAAETAEFAGEKRRFWDMHDGIYDNQENLGLPLFVELADDLGLPVDELTAALETGRFAPKVREHFLGGVRSGVNGTPTLFINEQRYDGVVSFDPLVGSIDEALALAKSPSHRIA